MVLGCAEFDLLRILIFFVCNCYLKSVNMLAAILVNNWIYFREAFFFFLRRFSSN